MLGAGHVRVNLIYWFWVQFWKGWEGTFKEVIRYIFNVRELEYSLQYTSRTRFSTINKPRVWFPGSLLSTHLPPPQRNLKKLQLKRGSFVSWLTIKGGKIECGGWGHWFITVDDYCRGSWTGEKGDKKGGINVNTNYWDNEQCSNRERAIWRTERSSTPWNYSSWTRITHETFLKFGGRN